MARLREVIAHPDTMGVIVQRITSAEHPETLRDIARAWQVPPGKLAEWITEDRVRSEQYANALRFAGEQAALETVKIADESRPEDAAKTKIQVQTRQWLAGRLARDRFGDSTEVKHTGAVSLIAVLSGIPRAAAIDVTPTPVLENVPAEKSPEKSKTHEVLI
jgi:hypothetical protein